jgi:hypothetical protein
MNCPIGTVRSRIFRAREAIATRLRPCSTPARASVGKAPSVDQTPNPLAAPMKPEPRHLPPFPRPVPSRTLRPKICALPVGAGRRRGFFSGAGLQAWRDDARARETWHAYHLIGDVLRSEELAHAPARDEAFLAGLRQRLAAEPAILAPAPVRPAAKPARARQPG